MTTQNIQLKDGNGNLLMPKTGADVVTLPKNTGTTNVRDELIGVGGITQRATYPQWTDTPASIYIPAGSWFANKYIINGYVTNVCILANNFKSVNYGVYNISEGTHTKIGSFLVKKGKNYIKLDNPVRVTENILFAIQQDATTNTHPVAFQGSAVGGIGGYLNGTSSNATCQYYLDYVTDNDGYLRKVDVISSLDRDVNYNGLSEILPSEKFNNVVYTTMQFLPNRYKYDYEDIKCGDHISINLNAGYKCYVGLIENKESLSWLRIYKSFDESLSYSLNYTDGNGFVLRILFAHSDLTTEITEEEVEQNCTVVVTRKNKSVVNVAKKEISILFVGNSLTQDAVSYAPFLLQNLYPDINFKFYVWYNGGFNLAQQLSYMVNNTACKTFSVCENCTRWTNFDNEKTMEEILSTYQFDIVSIQEMFNNKSSYTDDDKNTFNNVIDYINSHYTKNPLKYVSLFPAPNRTTPAETFALIDSAMEWQMRETISESVIPAGISIYRALTTELDSLGDAGHLSPDGVHAQEGLPCLIQAYVVLMWIYNQLSIPKSVYGNRLFVNDGNYNVLNVPGANLGNAIVVGTDNQNTIAQNVAIKSFKEGLKLVLDNLTQ